MWPIGSVSPATSRTRGVSIRRCTRRGPGRCASTPGSARPPSRTTATGNCSPPAPPGSPSRSTCPPRWATTRTIRSRSGEVGKVGVAIDSIDDMRRLFDGIPLDKVSTSMTINAPGSVLLLLYQLVAEEAGHPGRPADRHDPERHPQGVHRPGHVHLPAGAVAAAGRRHVRVLLRGDSEVEHHLDLRLPHGRGRRDARAGDRVHPRQRRRIREGSDRGRPRRRRFRAPAVVLLRRPDHAARRGREVPGGPADLGPDHARRVRRQGPEVADAALPHADRRRAAHRAAARGQPGPGGGAGARCGARRHPVAAHQLATTRRSRCRPRRRPGWPCVPSRSSRTRRT